MVAVPVASHGAVIDAPLPPCLVGVHDFVFIGEVPHPMTSRVW
jgi:hypothetical protein